MTWKPGVYGRDNGDDPDDNGDGGALQGPGRAVRRFRVSVNGLCYVVEVEELQAGTGPRQGFASAGPGPEAPELPPRRGAISGRPPWAGWGSRA